MHLFIKRLVDLLGALFGFALLLPLLIVLAVAIKLDSKGLSFLNREGELRMGVYLKCGNSVRWW